jgi:hypothetical protein
MTVRQEQSPILICQRALGEVAYLDLTIPYGSSEIPGFSVRNFDGDIEFVILNAHLHCVTVRGEGYVARARYDTSVILDRQPYFPWVLLAGAINAHHQ